MNILIIGRLPEDVGTRLLYEGLIEIVKHYANRVYTPIDTAEFEGGDEERYEKAFESVRESDLIIAEASQPSTGQGMEIREAHALGKPVIVIAKKGSKVSGLIKGCPAVKNIIFYNHADDLKEELVAALGPYY